MSRTILSRESESESVVVAGFDSASRAPKPKAAPVPPLDRAANKFVVGADVYDGTGGFDLTTAKSYYFDDSNGKRWTISNETPDGPTVWKVYCGTCAPPVLTSLGSEAEAVEYITQHALANAPKMVATIYPSSSYSPRQRAAMGVTTAATPTPSLPLPGPMGATTPPAPAPVQDGRGATYDPTYDKPEPKKGDNTLLFVAGAVGIAALLLMKR
jgi:hypothetical protein